MHLIQELGCNCNDNWFELLNSAKAARNLALRSAAHTGACNNLPTPSKIRFAGKRGGEFTPSHLYPSGRWV